MRRHSLAAAAVLLIAVLASLPSQAFVSDSGFRLVEGRTNFANMANYTLIGPDDMTAFHLVPGPKAVLVGGTGYVALLDFSIAQPRVSWAWSVIGRVTGLDYDDSWSPSWYAAGTDAGEILVVNALNPDFRQSYFTAGRVAVKSFEIATGQSETLAVVDAEGYLYIYKVPEPYWSEIGPEPRDAATGKLAGFSVVDAKFVKSLDGKGNWTKDSSRLIAILSDAPTSTAVAYAYYREGDEVKPVEVYQGKTVTVKVNATYSQNFTRDAILYYAFILSDYNIILNVQRAANATINETGLPATRMRLFAAYVITDYDPKTGEVIRVKCYATLTPEFLLEPGKTRVLGRIVLDKVNATSLEDCISAYNLDPNPPGPYQLDFQPVIVLNAATLPKPSINTGLGGDAWIIYYPYPAQLGSIASLNLLEVYRVPQALPGWPVGATTVILVGVDRYLYIYLADNSLVPKAFGAERKYVEVVDLGTAATSVSISWDGSSIFVGTASGKLFWLEWSPQERRYLAKASLQVDNARVNGVSYLAGDYVLVSTITGRLQLVRAQGGEWYPVWRGPYGYEGVETGVRGYKAEAVTPDFVVAGPETAAQTPVVYVLQIRQVDIARAIVNVEIRKVTIGGNVTVEVPSGGLMEVYDSNGDLVAVTQLQEGAFQVYLQAGVYNFTLRVPGLGTVSVRANVQFPEYRVAINASYREVLVKAVVPPPGEGEKYPPDVQPGPLAGAMIIAKPVQVDPNLGFQVNPKTVYGVTGDDGTATLILWEGVSYEIVVEKPGFENYTVQIPFYGATTVKATLKPVQVQEEQQPEVVKYHDVKIRVVDDRGQPVKLARVEVYYAANNTLVASTFTDEQGLAIVRLREGSYLLNASASGYTSKELAFSVPQTTDVTVSLNPTTVTKIKRMTPIFIAIAGVIVLVGVVYTLRERIARRLVEEEEYF